MKISHCLFVLLVSVFSVATCQESTDPPTFRAAFYNVENLFDTIDDPIGIDEEFMPGSKKDWTNERYEKKLMDLGKVIKGMDYPAIMGVCEVENEQVMKDLISKDGIKEVHYGIVHQNSPDMRGIDVGLLYDQDEFTLVSSSFIRVEFPKWLEPDGYTSREILQAAIKDQEGEVFNVFVNHWPSRRGGEEASEKRRVWVAQHLRQAVEGVFAENRDAKVIIMGDFNDEASNNSISNALGTMGVNDATFILPGILYNYFLAIQESGEGSYNYRGDWNMLDQVIVGGFDQRSEWQIGNHGIFREKWMMYKNDKGEESPSRTYGGPNYYGGYSDHLPVYMDFVKK